MSTVALGARLLLAIVFLVAAGGKLADPEGTRDTLASFRVPWRLRASFTWALPAAEIATAAALLITPVSRVGAAAAVVLLGIFVGGIAAAMARGEAPDCHCFGQISSSPAGRGTLARNAVLAVPAIFVLIYGGGRSASALFPSHGSAAAAAVALGAAVVLAAALAGAFLIQNRQLETEKSRLQGELDLFPPGLPVGAIAPRFLLPDADGQTVDSERLLSTGKPMALVFVSPGCGPCLAMMPELSRWQRTLGDRITIVLPAHGSAEELRVLKDRFELQNVVADENGELLKAFRGGATPSVVVVGADGRVATRIRSTHAIIEALIRRSLTENDSNPGMAPVSSVDQQAHSEPGLLEVLQAGDAGSSR